MGINGVEGLILPRGPFGKTFVDHKINTSARADKETDQDSQPTVKYYMYLQGPIATQKSKEGTLHDSCSFPKIRFTVHLLAL
jgi:hypothetical protein